MVKRKIYIAILLCQWLLSVEGQTITTIAGKYLPSFNGYGGDGGPAIDAFLSQPINICIDHENNFYISDRLNNVIRKIDSSGIITTYAGTSMAGYSGDGGDAKKARLNSPSCVAFDKKGNLYIADTYNHVIRKINPQGLISTIAGQGSPGYSGDGGPAINARLDQPSGIAIDDVGNLFISDFNTNAIRKVDIFGIIQTIAGDNIAGYRGDGGPARQARISNVCLMHIDSKGDLYFADRGNNVIRKINLKTDIIETIAGTGVLGNDGDGGQAKNARLNAPYDVCFDSFNNIYISDSHNNTIRKVDTTGIMTTVAGTGQQGYSGDGGSPLQAQLGVPCGILVDNNGDLEIVEAANNTIRKIAICKKTIVQPLVFKQWACEGDSISFQINADSKQKYQWQWNNSQDQQWNRIDGLKEASGQSTNRVTIFPVNRNMNGMSLRCIVDNSCSSDTIITKPLKVYLKDTPIVISVDKNNLCPNEKITFTVNPFDTSLGINYEWLINGTAIQNGGGEFSTRNLKNRDQVTCVRFNQSPCSINGKNQSNSIEVSVQNVSPVTFSIDASSTEVCQGTPVTFKVVGSGLTNSAAYQWFVNGIPQKFIQNSFVDTLLRSCSINCIVSQNCFQDSLPNSLIINVLPKPQVNVTANSTWIHADSSIQLKGSITGSYSQFWWTPISAMQNSQSLEPIVSPKQTTTYQLTATSGKCVDKAEIKINVIYPFRMPTIFSPNGDNINDVFRIPPDCVVDLLKFSVFDRWGNVLFTTEDLRKGWDGSFQGKPCPVGTYVYLIQAKENGKQAVYTGTITLIR